MKSLLLSMSAAFMAYAFVTLVMCAVSISDREWAWSDRFAVQCGLGLMGSIACGIAALNFKDFK